MTSHAFSENVRGGGWFFVGEKRRELVQEAIICGNSVELVCSDGLSVVMALKFDLTDWPASPEAQMAFLKAQHSIPQLEQIVGGARGIRVILVSQMEAVNGARERLIRSLGFF